MESNKESSPQEIGDGGGRPKQNPSDGNEKNPDKNAYCSVPCIRLASLDLFGVRLGGLRGEGLIMLLVLRPLYVNPQR